MLAQGSRTIHPEAAELQTAQPVPEAAQAMIDALASVGVHSLGRTYLDLQDEMVAYRSGIPPAKLRDWIPKMLDWAAQHQYSVIIRPTTKGTVLIQLDDLTAEMMDRLRPVAFLGLETSPGNFQAWLALPAAEADRDFANRLRDGVGADENASGAARIAGSINFKEKHAPNYPVVQLVHTAPGLINRRAQIEALGVVAAPEPVPPRKKPVDAAAQPDVVHEVRRVPVAWPRYADCLRGAPPNGDGTGPDRSRADYFWCLLAIQWGWSVEETADRLMKLSEKARENGGEYARRTARKAAEGVERNWRHAG